MKEENNIKETDVIKGDANEIETKTEEIKQTEDMDNEFSNIDKETMKKTYIIIGILYFVIIILSILLVIGLNNQKEVVKDNIDKETNSNNLNENETNQNQEEIKKDNEIIIDEENNITDDETIIENDDEFDILNQF